MLLPMLACGNKKEEPSQTEPLPVTRIVGIGKVTPQGGVSELASPSSGIVREIVAIPGDAVKEGDILVVLDNADQILSLREAESRIASQQRSLQSAKINVERERIALKEKQRLLNDARELLQAGATSGENVRTLQNEYEQGVQQLRKLESDLQAQQAQLNEAAVQRDARLKDLSRTQLAAPMNGRVLDISARVGEALNVHETYARMSPEAPLIVLAEIDELFANKLTQGQNCSIYLVGDSTAVATGDILRVSADLKRKSLFSDGGNEMEDRRVREIEVSLRDMKSPLLIDTKVECVVHLN